MKTKARTSLTVVSLSHEQRELAVADIQRFFKKERGEELGIIAAETILDFFLEGLGNRIYNTALEDAKRWFLERMEDVEYAYDSLYRPL